LLLSIPRLRMKEVTIGDSSEQAHLDREGIMHLSGTGFPYQRGSNTYIVGHAGDYDTSRVPNPFRNLKELRAGDLIALRDATGKTYNYRIYDRFVVAPPGRLGHGARRRQRHRHVPNLFPHSDLRQAPHSPGRTGEVAEMLPYA
jgi:hypothetical protein